MKMLKNEIVFITDNWDKENEYSLKRRNIEGNSEKVALEIKKELELISDTVTMYKSPSEFCQNINQHKDSIVLSTYYGEAAKNSKALIPGMCEANHMLYVGLILIHKCYVMINIFQKNTYQISGLQLQKEY